jgi:hypothetical protein
MGVGWVDYPMSEHERFRFHDLRRDIAAAFRRG